MAAVLFVGVGLAGSSARASPLPPRDPNLPQTCDDLSWPLRLPGTVGRTLDFIFADPILRCVYVTKAIAPDGHDVMDDQLSQAYRWLIISTSPPAGTPVVKNQLISMTVVPV